MIRTVADPTTVKVDGEWEWLLATIISDRLPHNLLQARRDYFGAHTYERLDQEGIFHAAWIQMRRKPED